MTNNSFLPEDWQLKKLNETSKIILGQSPSSDTYNTEKRGLPFFQGKAEFGKFYPTPIKWCSDPKKIAQPGDILISVRAPVGPTNVCQETSCIGRGLAAIRTNNDVLNNYVLYYLRSIEEKWDKKATGTTFKAITGNVLRNQEIPIPPYDEQKRIVSKIEELFSQLDAGVAGLKRAQAGLKRYRASVLKAAFEGRLVPQDPNDEPARKLLQRIQKKSSIIDETLKLPQNWVMVKLKAVGEIVTGRTPKKSRTEFYGDDFPFYKPTDLNAGFYTKSAADNLSSLGITKARLLPEKSILVTCIGATIGKTGLIRTAGASNQQINAIIPDEFIHPEFLYYVCLSPQFQQMIINNASATTLPIINKSKFSDLSFPLPPYNEQIRIADEVDRHLSIIEKLESVIDLQIGRSESLRNSILSLAFAGKLISK